MDSSRTDEFATYIEMVTPTDVVEAMGIIPLDDTLTDADQLMVEKWHKFLLQKGSRAAARSVVWSPTASRKARDNVSIVHDYLKRAVAARNRYMRRAWRLIKQAQASSAQPLSE
jgi:hypothetical protein